MMLNWTKPKIDFVVYVESKRNWTKLIEKESLISDEFILLLQHMKYWKYSNNSAITK